MVRTNLEVAGFANAQGQIGKSIPPGRIYIPGQVWIAERHLCWELSPAKGLPWKTCEPKNELLDDFIELWEAPDEKILTFAKRHGVLWEHQPEMQGREPLERWRNLSRVATAFLNIGAEVSSGKRRIDAKEWAVFSKPDKDQLRALESPETSRFFFETLFNNWMGDIGFRLAAKDEQFGLEIDYHGRMINALALQIALTLSRSERLYICSGCGRPYARTKNAPREGQANFCDRPACGRDAALRRADARRRAKMAEARRLQAEGLLPKEIAQRIDANLASVRRWIKKGK